MDDKVDLKSLDIQKDKIEQLEKAFPEVVTEGKVDFEKLKAELGEEIETGKERYEMKWPGKANLSKIIQESSIGTLKPVKDASVDFDTTENLFIEGDSLEVLKLLQKSYYGKVKIIYIDPPYNTGNDFVYPDNFSESLDTYLRYTGQKGEEGLKLTTNAETEGRYHSKWINMMYPRLFLSRNLLKEDGVIFISIDDHEIENLKKICNEVFGEENVDCVIWKKIDPKYDKNVNAKIVHRTKRVHEYILICYKNKEETFFGKLKKLPNWLNEYTNPDNDSRGPYKQGIISFEEGHKNEDKNSKNYYTITTPSGRPITRQFFITKGEFEDLVSDNRIYFPRSGDGIPALKLFQYEEKDFYFETILEGLGSLNSAKKELNELFPEIVGDIFDTPKPSKLIQELIRVLKDSDCIVLDFLAGSATTAHAVLDLNKKEGNRKYIMVQLQEPTPEDSEPFKAGYKNIAEIGEERIRRVIKKIKEENEGKLDFDGKKMDLGFKVFRLSESNFKIWDKKGDSPIPQQLQLSVSNIQDDSSDEEILYEIILKSGFELSVKVEDVNIQGKKVYSVDDKSLLICLENNLSQEFIKEVADLGGVRAVFLDRGFEGNDQLKTNTVELMKAKDIEFKTV